MILAVNWPHVWMVTLLGFGIVLLLLFFLIFVMMGFGWVMQRINAPAAPKAAPAAAPAPAPKAETKAASAEDADLAAVAYCMSLASDDKAAVAYALYLYNHAQEFPTPVMPLQSRNTAWNSKAYNMNNLGF